MQTVEQVVPEALKLLFALAESNRYMMSMMDVATIIGEETKSELTKELIRSNRAYTKTVKDLGAGHNCGPPAVWLLATTVDFMIHKYSSEEAKSTKWQQVKAFMTENKEDPEMLYDQYIGMYKLTKAFSKKGEPVKRKIQLKLKDSGLQKLLVEEFCGSPGWSKKKAVAPRGAIERDIQGFLDLAAKGSGKRR